MREVIKGRTVVPDPWLRLPLETARVPREGRFIVPLALWRDASAALLARRQPLGVWLDAHEEPALVGEDLWCFELIALRIPKFSDGRAYSAARLLRERYGWRGELRAFGDVLRDQLLFLARCGFDSFELREGEDPHAALAALGELPVQYQASYTEPLPLFRRRARA